MSDANSSPLQLRETIYLLAVGYYRSGDYSKSRELVEQCLMVWYLASYMFMSTIQSILHDDVISNYLFFIFEIGLSSLKSCKKLGTFSG